MAKLSKKQKEAVKLIKRLEERFSGRWFTQPELPGITMHTMIALIEKGVLERDDFHGMAYYKLCMSETDLWKIDYGK